jgi:ribosomal protein S18 acetylase RimI-like enzyme
VRRVAVDPAWQRQGVGTALMRWAHDHARTAGLPEVRIGVRLQLPGNLRFYQRLGYQVLGEHRHPGYDRVTWVEMGRAV